MILRPSIFQTCKMGRQEEELKTACIALITTQDVKYSEFVAKHYRQLAISVGLSVAEVRKMLRDMEQRWKAYKELLAADGSAITYKDGYFISTAPVKFWKNAAMANKSYFGLRWKSLSGLEYAVFTIIFKDCELQNLPKEGIGDSKEELKRKWSSVEGSSGSQGKRKSDSASGGSMSESSSVEVQSRAVSKYRSSEEIFEETVVQLKKLGKSLRLLTSSALSREETRKFFVSLKDESAKLKFLDIVLGNS